MAFANGCAPSDELVKFEAVVHLVRVCDVDGQKVGTCFME